MIKREYVVKNDKLCYADNDPAFPSEGEECTKEELTALIIKQDKNRAELSDDYIEKVANAMKEATSVDTYYDLYKTALNGLLASGMDDVGRVVELAKSFAYHSLKLFEK